MIRLQVTHLIFEPDEFLFQVLRLSFRLRWLRAIGGIQGVHIALDAFLNLLDALLQFVRREVLVPVIHGLELAVIDGNQRFPLVVTDYSRSNVVNRRQIESGGEVSRGRYPQPVLLRIRK